MVLSLRLVASLEPVPTGVTTVGASSSSLVSDVRVGGLAWLLGVRVGDLYVRWPTDDGGEVSTAAGHLGLPDEAPARPWLTLAGGLAAAVAALALRRWLPTLASVLLVGVTALLTWELLGVVGLPFAPLVIGAPTAVLVARWVVTSTTVRARTVAAAAGITVGLAAGSLLVSGPDTWRTAWAAASFAPLGVGLATAVAGWAAATVEARRSNVDLSSAAAALAATTAGRAVLWDAREGWRDHRALWLHDTVLPRLASGIREFEAGRANSGSSALRSLAHDLRGDLETDQLAVLRAGGLAAAIGDALAAAECDGLDCELTVDAAGDPPPWVVVVGAWRVAQEAISNARRHSSADRIKVVVASRRDLLTVEVVDDGVGLADLDRHRIPGHLGLQAMRGAASGAGARLRLDHADPTGLRVRFEWSG